MKAVETSRCTARVVLDSGSPPGSCLCLLPDGIRWAVREDREAPSLGE